MSRIFAAHLSGTHHGYASDNTEATPTLDELGADVAAMDRWYLDYLETVSPKLLSESVPFIFTNGDKAMMSRQEMLTYVVTHGGYHRGEIGRILVQLASRRRGIRLPCICIRPSLRAGCRCVSRLRCRGHTLGFQGVAASKTRIAAILHVPFSLSISGAQKLAISLLVWKMSGATGWVQPPQMLSFRAST